MKVVQKLGVYSFFCMLSMLGMAARAQSVGQGYITEDAGLRPGMVVILSSKGTAEKPQVERASSDNTDKIVGVTSSINDNTVIIASGEQQVYVQTSGEVTAYVSDINGHVKKGDALAVSPLKGILMRAETPAIAVAISLEDYGSPESSMPIKSDVGSKTTGLAKLRVSLDNALATKPSPETPSVLQRVGQALAHKNVSEIQVVGALVIFLIVIVAEAAIIYGAISSSIVSLGRNPMAKRTITSALVLVIITAIAVLGIGLTAAYGVLQL